MALRKVKPLTPNEMEEQAKLDKLHRKNTQEESAVLEEVGTVDEPRQTPAPLIVEDHQKNVEWMEDCEEIKPSKS